MQVCETRLLDVTSLFMKMKTAGGSRRSPCRLGSTSRYRKARYKEVNVDDFRKHIIDSRHCDSSIDTRAMHDVVLGGGSTLPKDRFEELNTDYFRKSAGPLWDAPQRH